MDLTFVIENLLNGLQFGLMLFFSKPVELFPGFYYSSFRLFIIGAGLAVAVMMYLIVVMTRLWMLVRAGKTTLIQQISSTFAPDESIIQFEGADITRVTILVIDKFVDRLPSWADRHTVVERERVVWSGNSGKLRASPDM